jgi:hypothetical protein
MASDAPDLRDPRPRSIPARHTLLALAAFVALTVLHTWPLATAPGYWSRNNSGDTVLNEWAVTWVAHALTTNPLRLYDANIFYPDRRTLAYSEHLVVQGVIAVPILLLGGSAVLAFNVAMMAGFALTGLAFCLLVRSWTGSWAAGAVAGSLASFNAHAMMRLPHLQTLHLEFFALALFAMDRLFLERRARYGVALGVAHALEGLTSIYLLMFTSWALVFAALARMPDWLGRGRRHTVLLLVGAALVAAAVLSPFLWNYYLVNREMGFIRSVNDARFYAASWADYMMTGARVHWSLWSRSFAGSGKAANFPGIVATALACVTLVTGVAWRDRRARMALFIMVGCVVLSVAPRLPGYELLWRLAPILRVVRVMAHFGQVALVALAILAGFGVAWLERRWGMRRGWIVAAATLVILVNGEALRAPYAYTPFTGIPAVYQPLRKEAHAAIADLPLYPRRAIFGNTGAMLASTIHWHPIVNGYSGFIPPSYYRIFDALRGFPDERALSALHALGITHVVIRRDEFIGLHGRAQYDAIAKTHLLEPYSMSDAIQIYRLHKR